MKKHSLLGLTAVLAIILTASIGAASASASGFEAEAHPATVFGVTEGAYGQVISGPEWGAGCDGLETESSASTPSHSLTTKLITDGNCAWFSAGATLKMKGCQLTYHPGSEVSPGRFGGSFEIGPANCGPIVYTQGNPTKCEVEIGAQSGLTATYENVVVSGKDRVRVTAEATNLKYTQKSGGLCKAGSFENGKWSGTSVLQASNGNSIGIKVKDKIRTPIAITGKASAEPSQQPKFESSYYPVALSGEQLAGGAKHTFSANAGSSSCSSAKYTEEVTGATTALGLSPVFGGECTTFGFTASAPKMNGCELVANIANAGPPYSGTADIACPVGQSIELVAKLGSVTKCTVTIPAQTGLKGATFTNADAGYSVVAGLSLTGIRYQQQTGTGLGSCKNSGEFTDGGFTGSVSLQGLS